MFSTFRSRLAKFLITSLCFFAVAGQASAQSNKVMGEVHFEGASKVERDSGVWIDGEYVGFLKEFFRGVVREFLRGSFCG